MERACFTTSTFFLLKKIVNKENDWDQTTNADVMLGPIARVARAEIINAVKKMKLGKAAGPCEVNAQILVTS